MDCKWCDSTDGGRAEGLSAGFARPLCTESSTKGVSYLLIDVHTSGKYSCLKLKLQAFIARKNVHFEAGKFIPGVILDLSFARAKLGQMILTLVLALNELWNYFVLWHVYDCEIVFEWEIFTPIAKEHYIFIFTALPSDFVLERKKKKLSSLPSKSDGCI